jgi:hypothetical protein
VFNLCRFEWLNSCLSSFLVPFHSSSTPFYPRSATSQGTCLDSLPFRCSHFIFSFESIKEFGNASTWDFEQWHHYLDYKLIYTYIFAFPVFGWVMDHMITIIWFLNPSRSVFSRFSLQVFHIMSSIYSWSKVLVFLFMFELHACLFMFFFHTMTIDH